VRGVRAAVRVQRQTCGVQQAVKVYCERRGSGSAAAKVGVNGGRQGGSNRTRNGSSVCVNAACGMAAVTAGGEPVVAGSRHSKP